MPGRRARRRRLAVCLLTLITAGLLVAGPARAVAPPDGRGWEMVSPPEKNGGQVAAPGALWGGGVLQAAAGGGTATFSSAASFGGGAAGAPPASQYLSTRTASGWVTRNVTPPTISGAYGPGPEGVPYQLFSADLSRALMLDGRRCASGTPCPRSYSLRGGGGSLLADSPAAQGLRLAGATPDLSHLVLQTCAALTPEAGEEPEGEGCAEADTNLYEWGGGALTLIDEPSGGSTPGPFGRLAAPGGAISTDGRRVYWYQLEDGPLRLHEEGRPSRALPETTGGGAAFQAASADGARAFYTVAGTLYRYSAATGASEQVATGVTGVLGASEDGSIVFYQAAAGLFRWDEGTTTEVAAGAEAAAPGDWPPATGTARLTADGQVLAFLSREPLTGYANRDPRSGEADAELFRWQAGVGLACVSCDPSGARPRGPAAIPGAEPNGSLDLYRPRALSADGRRLFFESPDPLVPGDANGAADVYEWEAAGEGTCTRAGGCLGLISSGLAAGGARFADASASGADVFFLTEASLVGFDPAAVDLYDAREGGGFPEAAPEAPCNADACQPIPAEPEDAQPGTLQGGPPNPPLRNPSLPCPRGERRLKKHGHVRCVARHRHRHRRGHRRARHGRRHAGGRGGGR